MEEEEEFSLYLTGGLLHFVGDSVRRFAISSSCCPEYYNTDPPPAPPGE
jgi:hypothetical protein